MGEKLRADVALVQRGLCESREKAQAQIMAGNVFVGLRKINKASEAIFPNDDLNVKTQDNPFVSRGGKNLEKALNVFSGSVKGGKLYLAEDCVLDVPGIADQDVYVGIRPEGFELDPNGPMHCQLSNVEVMGRDSSIVSTHPASQNPVVRSIIDADNKVEAGTQTVRFSLKAHKVFVFSKETEERIQFEVK